MTGCFKPPVTDCSQAKVSIWTTPPAMGRHDCGCAPAPVPALCDPCGSTSNVGDCEFSWSLLPFEVSPGGIAKFTAVNLPPNIQFHLDITGEGTNYLLALTSNGAGVCNADVVMPLLGGTYQITPQVQNCTAKPLRNSVTVVTAVQNPGAPCECLGTVTITPVFVTPVMYSGTQVDVAFVVTNHNSCPATDITLPALTLGDGLTAIPGDELAISGLTVAGNSSTTLTHRVTVANGTADDLNVNISVPQSTATYKCGGATFYAGGGAGYGVIKSSATGTCALAIDSFGFSPASIVNGGTALVTLVLKNNGSNPITNVAIGPINVGAGIVTCTPASDLEAVGETIAPGASLTLTATCAFTAAPLAVGTQHAHQLLIPAGAAVGTCNFGNVSNVMPAGASLIING